MGVRNKKREILRRLDSKTLDARFLNEIQNGLNCSPFEAEAVIEVVKEVYFPFHHLEQLMPSGTCLGGGKNPAGGESMINNKNDRLKAGLRPLLAKTLENALSHRIAKEFPRIGGPCICRLCAEMIMEVVNNHIRSKDYVHHGQIVWTAVSIDRPPGRNKKMEDTELVNMVLDAGTAEDIQSPPVES